MKVILFGASGMVGQGVLRECLLDPGIEQIVSVERPAGDEHTNPDREAWRSGRAGRNGEIRRGGLNDAKLERVMHRDFSNFSAIENKLTGFDACFFTLGTTAVGKTEDQYSRVNYNVPVAAGGTLSRLNPGMTFIYVSGQGTDSSECGGVMWARVKGRTENVLLKLPFAAYMFRPGLIVPLHGIRSKTGWYNIFYTVGTPLLWFAVRLAPAFVSTTERIARAMLEVARQGAPKRILETRDIDALYQSSLKRSHEKAAAPA